MREVEFLPDWYPKVRQRKRMVTIQAWGSMALICVLGLWMLLAQRNVHAKEAELTSLHKDLDQSESQLQQLEDLLQLQLQLGKQDQIFVKIGRPVETTKLVTTLEQLMPRDMALLGLSLETEEGTNKPGGSLASRAAKKDAKNAAAAAESKLRLRLHGVAPTDVDLGEFLAKIQSKPFFKQIELIYSHERQESGHVMREFEVCFVMELNGMGHGNTTMRALRTQAEWCARVQLILGIAVIVLLCGFVAIVYRPSSERLDGLRRQTSDQRNRLNDNLSQVRILPDVMLTVDRMQSRLERFDKKLPRQPELGPFINDITEVSHQANLRKVTVEPGVPSRTDLFTEWPISLKFEGDFTSVFAFLRRTEAMQRLTQVRGLKVRSIDNGKSGQVQVELSMNIYFSEG